MRPVVITCNSVAFPLNCEICFELLPSEPLWFPLENFTRVTKSNIVHFEGFEGQLIVQCGLLLKFGNLTFLQERGGGYF